MKKLKFYKPELINQWKLIKDGKTDLVSILSVDVSRDIGYAQGQYYSIHLSVIGFCVKLEMLKGMVSK